MGTALSYGYLIATCLVLAVATVCIHMYALFLLRIQVQRILKHRSFQHHVMYETVVVSSLMVALCATHISEMLVWAVGYLFVGAIDNVPDAVYFSLTTYTTVGPDGVSIATIYRGIAGFESLIGPMMIAWSTAFLVEYVTRFRSSGPHGPPE